MEESKSTKIYPINKELEVDDVIAFLGVLLGLALLVYVVVYVAAYNSAIPLCKSMGYNIAVVLPDLSVSCWP